MSLLCPREKSSNFLCLYSDNWCTRESDNKVTFDIFFLLSILGGFFWRKAVCTIWQKCFLSTLGVPASVNKMYLLWSTCFISPKLLCGKQKLFVLCFFFKVAYKFLLKKCYFFIPKESGQWWHETSVISLYQKIGWSTVIGYSLLQSLSKRIVYVVEICPVLPECEETNVESPILDYK